MKTNNDFHIQPDNSIIEVLSDFLCRRYHLGWLSRIEKIEKGYENESYKIEGFSPDGPLTWYVRIYSASRNINNILHEHDLLLALPDRGFRMAPSLVRNKQGRTWDEIDWPLQKRFISVFDYMEGDHSRNWDSFPAHPSILSGSAEILEQYHHAVHDYFPSVESHVFSIPRHIRHMKKSLLPRLSERSLPSDDIHSILEHSGDQLSQSFLKMEDDLSPHVVDALPKIVVHGDFHMGNMIFSDFQIIGLVDFDWSHMDARIFDIAFALTYLCWSWHESAGTFFDFSMADQFLCSYQLCASRRIKGLKGLCSAELACVSHLMALGHFIQLYWTLSDYEARPPRSNLRHLQILRHSIEAIEFIYQNQPLLDRAFSNISKEKTGL